MKRIPSFLAPLALALSVLIASGPAHAGGSGPGEVAEIDILPGWRLADGRHMAAIRIRLADGWKTYWRAPGDAGIPPEFDWSGSRNLEGVEYHWPVPEVFDLNGMRTIGYTHELILPIELEPRRAGKAITLKGSINLGVCRDVCMPMQARVSARLGVATGADRVIARALDQRPDTATEAGLGRISCDLTPIDDGLRLTAELALPLVGPDEVAVIETADASVWVSEAMIARSGGLLTATADLVPPAGVPFMVDRSGVRITILAAGRAVDIRGCTAGS
jgi:DsbC/DsbD-like thiol-disulfide interchange protein